MSKIKFSLYEYDLPLTTPLQLKGGELKSRVGIIIVGENDKGNVASGETAPLPFFSSETFPIAKEEAITITRSINEGKSHAIDSLVRAARSVAFGFDSVLQQLNQSELHPIRSSVSINALLSGDPATILSLVIQKRELGFCSFKLKIGLLPIEETIALVKELRSTLDDQCQFRLDANRSLSIEQTLHLAAQLADIGIEYFEEPVNSSAELEELIKNTSLVRLALDESLSDVTNDTLFQYPQVTALVIKPTILGPFRTRHLIEKAKELNKQIVISSSFESPIGIAQLARLASSLENDTPCGLDTLSVFADDPLGCSNWIRNGRIKVDDLPTTFDLSTDQFRKIV